MKVLIPKDFVSVGQFLKLINSNSIRLSYTGLMYYRNLGLIPKPLKIKGYKERFYNTKEIVPKIETIKKITTRISLKEFAKRRAEGLANARA